MWALVGLFIPIPHPQLLKYIYAGASYCASRQWCSMKFLRSDVSHIWWEAAGNVLCVPNPEGSIRQIQIARFGIRKSLICIYLCVTVTSKLLTHVIIEHVKKRMRNLFYSFCALRALNFLFPPFLSLYLYISLSLSNSNTKYSTSTTQISSESEFRFWAWFVLKCSSNLYCIGTKCILKWRKMQQKI